MSIEIPGSGANTTTLVTAALRSAGDKTGVSFDFLLNMAKRESSLDPTAKAKTSSAAGLFQFIEQTWLGALKSHGEKHGLGDYAADITRNASGKYRIADALRREEILNLRFDAKAASALAGELANDNKRALEAKLGRGVSNAELYAAHFLGAGGASKILSAKDNAIAATLLPRAAAANRHVFYDGDRARSVGEVMASITKSMSLQSGSLQSGSLQSGASQSGASQLGASIPGEVKAFAPIAGAGPALEYKSAIAAQTIASRLRDGVSLSPERAVPQERAAPQASVQPANTMLAQFSNRDLPGRLPLPENLAGASDAGLSALAMTVLQALDPTRLGSKRDDRTQ